VNNNKEFLAKISKKGVIARQKLRRCERKLITLKVEKMLKNNKNYSLLARLCGFIMGDGCLELNCVA
jgi:hypothetical protein